MGLHRVGREAIRELLLAEHTGTMSESELLVEHVDVHPGPDTASAEIDGVLKGVRAPNGRPYDLPHSISALFVRSGQDWQIRTMTPVTNPRR